MKIIYKEPLVYFLIIAGLFFVASNLTGPAVVDDGKIIVVDRISLLRYMQLKTKAVDQDLLIRSFDTMPESKRQELIAGYVREEALYREAQSLGLHKDDPVIKGRVLQKLDFITKDYSKAMLKVDDEQLEKYYADNKKSYYIEPYVTFTHVFFDREFHGDELIQKLAIEKLWELNAKKVSFAEGVQHGDRFPFHVNYVERTSDFITSHFGEVLSKQVFDFSLMVEKAGKKWRGPYQSSYGSHLVMVSRLEEGRFPELVDVVSQVYQDFKREQTQKNLDNAYQSIVDTYTVELSLDLDTKPIESDLLASSASE